MQTNPLEPNSSIALKALEYFSSAACSLVGRSSVKFEAASHWARLAQDINHSSTSCAYVSGVNLISELAWPGSLVENRHYQIRKVRPFIINASIFAIQIGQCTTAVEWIEQGCSIIWSQLLQLRALFAKLKERYPIQGMELESLSARLTVQTQATAPDIFLNDGLTLEVAKDFHEIAEQRRRLINEIRKLPGYEKFLLPKQFSEISMAATDNPVILLISSNIQADALVLIPGLSDDVLHIPLPFLNDRVLQALLGIRRKWRQNPDVKEEAFRGILLMLWIRVAKPIVDGLALTVNSSSYKNLLGFYRSFPFLPIHAAGDYSSNAPLGSKLSEYAISSYTPSLTALLEAQSSYSNQPRDLKVLAVAQPSTLPGFETELDYIQKYAGDSITVKTLKGSNATVARVAEEMRRHEWAHFACHGTQDSQDPLQSGLVLESNSKLTINDIITMQLPPKGLAFLSACQTATGDENLSTEAVHLAAGMLSAGYRSVIATMWSISDSHAPQVANDVYRFLFKDGKNDSTQVAEALHYAIQNLQLNTQPSFATWVPFIHIGV
ncbi:CHAT domain-containing protein [Rhodocollybia butyracea]|uniref:CHAT domain-containing protein n=1 Tax=Rhodocollybia butyracea TaxID=206335 RepID=A0A9P5PKI8_9AGAR|nr:CHAT domain-containing protein [Rhodocollybia butyracea]